MRKIIIASLVMLFALTSCVKEENFEQTIDKKYDPEKLVMTHLYGLVKNEQDVPIANALVSLKTFDGIKTTLTDQKGNYYIDSVLVTQSVYLQVEKSGYFRASRRMTAQVERNNYTVIQMMDRIDAGNFSASSGGSIALEDGSSVTIPAGGVMDKNGSSYSGKVYVKMNRIDPSSLDIFEQMPGDLSGFDEAGNFSSMASYGMLMVELEAEDGSLLQIAEGSEASLKFVVPDALLADAPSQIPLWFFNEEEGYWYEDGIAELNGNYYEGNVSHFTTWNCDRKGEVIDLNGEIHCELNLETLPYLRVYIYQEDVPIAGGYLTADGLFTFLNFYANELFTIKVLNHCDEIIWEQDFGPYAEDTDLGEIIIEDCGDRITISGSPVDCDANPVQNGIVQLFTDQGEVFQLSFEDGSFEISTLSCNSAEMHIIVTDVDNQKSSQPVTFDGQNGDVDLGVIEVCDELDEYFVIYYELPDGDNILDTILYLDPEFNSYEQEGYFVSFDNNENDSLNYAGGNLALEWNNIQLGQNLAQSFYYSFGEQGAPGETYCNYWTSMLPPLNDFEVELSQLDLAPGAIIKGTFEGEVKTNEDVIKMISGKFKVRVE